MSEYLAAFALGNAAILGNVCMLPLYPGLFTRLLTRYHRVVTFASGLLLVGIAVLGWYADIRPET